MHLKILKVAHKSKIVRHSLSVQKVSSHMEYKSLKKCTLQTISVTLNNHGYNNIMTRTLCPWNDSAML